MPEIVDNKILRLLNVEVGFRRRLHKIARTWTFELFNRPSLEVVCYRRRSNPWHHTPKLWLWCWNTQESTTQAPKRAYDSLLIWSSRSSKRPFSFEFQEFKQPQHKCLLYPRFGHALIQAFELFWFWLLWFSFWFGTFVLDFVFFRFSFSCQIKFMIWTCYFYMFLWFFQFWFCIFYYFYDIRFNGDTFK